MSREAAAALLKFDAEFSKLVTQDEQTWDLIQKAWSDKARQAAAEARRHRDTASQHRRDALNVDAEKAKKLHQAAELHDQAAGHYERAERHYGAWGGRKWPTAAVWGLAGGGLFSPVGASAGLGVRAFRAHRQHKKAIGFGERADRMSSSIA
jgi:hypothetical protein